MFFEDHKNIWVYQKCLNSTIVMVELQNASKIMCDVVIKEEKSEDRRQRILGEIEKLFHELYPSLETKGREQFNTKFNNLRNFITDLNATA